MKRSRRRKNQSMRVRKRIASFLALCMAVNATVQSSGIAFAENEPASVEAKVISLDTEKMKAAAEAAVASDYMVVPPSVLATASGSDAVPFQNLTYELADAETLLAEGTSMPENTKIRIFLEPDEAGYGYGPGAGDDGYDWSESGDLEESEDEDDGVSIEEELGITDENGVPLYEEESGDEESEDDYDEDSEDFGGESDEAEDESYTITGNEKLIFMVENTGRKTEGYQFQFGNKITDLIVVESKSAMKAEYDVEEGGPAGDESQGGSAVAPGNGGAGAGGNDGNGSISGPAGENGSAGSENAGNAGDSGNVENNGNGENGESGSESGSGSQGGAGTATGSDASASAKDVLEKTWNFLTGTMVTYAATATASDTEDEILKATDSDALEFKANEAKELIHLSVNAVNALIDSKLETVNVAGDDLGLMAASLEMDDDGVVGKVSSVGMFALNYGDVMDVTLRAVRDGDGIGVTLYNYASGYEESGTFVSKDGYKREDVSWAKDTINGYLTSQNSSMLMRFETADGDRNTNQKYNYWRLSDGVNPNITWNMAEKDGGNNNVVNFSALFPNSSQSEQSGNQTIHQVDVYPNVNVEKFLKLDEEGYYAYDSRNNAAVFNQDDSSLIQTEQNTSSDRPGFWPFGDRTPFFGMEMNFDFYKPTNGRFNKKPMVFNFSGDDDVWVYLEDERGKKQLVLDLGGIHGRVNGEIDFSTGLITYSGGFRNGEENYPLINNVNGIVGEGKEQKAYTYLYTRADAESAGINATNIIEYLNLPREGEVYKLHFFYLERGSGDSNCAVKFNLPILPTEEIQVMKEVQTHSANDMENMSYSFELVSIPAGDDSENSLNALKKYRDEAVKDPDIELNIQPLYIDADSSVTLNKLAKEDYFYIREINAPVNAVVTWEIMAGKETVRLIEANPARQDLSGIYQVIKNEQNGFLIKCLNAYDDLTPEYHKRAWKDWTQDKEGIYDVVLDVSGDTIYRNTENKEESIQNPTVTDIISSDSKVSFSDPVETGVDAPNLYLTQGAIAGTSAAGANEIVKGEKLAATVNGNVVTYTQNNTTVATYTITNSADQNGTLTWYPAALSSNELKYGNTYSLSYEVKATGKYEEDAGQYPDMAGDDTGTHENTKGYFSNVSAVLKYDQLGEGKELKYPQPVIRPGDVRYQTFTLKKGVVTENAGDDQNEDAEYTFHISVRDDQGNSYNGVITVGGEELFPVSDGKYVGTYEIKLKDEGQAVIGLPEDYKYKIVEEEFDDGVYAVTQTTVKKDNGKPEEGNTVEEIKNIYGEDHTYLFTNTVSPYRKLVVNKVVEGRDSGTYGFSLDMAKDGKFPKIFKVEEDGTKKELSYLNFSIAAEEDENGKWTGSAEFRIHPKINGEEVVITEVQPDGAWKTETTVKLGEKTASEPSVKVNNEKQPYAIVKVDADPTVTFTNYYYNHSLQLKKQVEGYNPNPGTPEEPVTYDFDIEFQLADGTELTETEQEQIVGTIVKFGVGARFYEAGNTISVQLPAGKSITLTGLPQKVTGAIVKENIEETREGEYKLYLDRVVLDDRDQTGESLEISGSKNSVRVDFAENKEDSHSITFVNRYEKRMGKLSITKGIVDKNGQATAIDESRAFQFKIEQIDGDGHTIARFYKTVTVANGEKEAKETITVPVGEYRITEILPVKYHAYKDDIEKEATVTEGVISTAIFKNYKHTDSYFTDVDIKVNKVQGSNGVYRYTTDQEAKGLFARLFGGSSEPAAVLPSKDEE